MLHAGQNNRKITANNGLNVWKIKSIAQWCELKTAATVLDVSLILHVHYLVYLTQPKQRSESDVFGRWIVGGETETE